MNTTLRKQSEKPSKKHVGLLGILVVEVCILGLFLFLIGRNYFTKQSEWILTKPWIATMNSSAQIEILPTEEQLLNAYIEAMPIEEKIGQLFYVTVGNLEEPNNSISNDYQELSEQAYQSLEQYHPGGVILMGGNISSDEQVKELTSELQSATSIPLYIGVDEEGGTVSRFGSTSGITMENVGAMSEVGATGNVTTAYEIGKTLAT